MCTMDESVLQQYIDQDLSEAERWILEGHVQECPDCRRTLNQLKILDWDLQHRAVEAAPELSDLRQRVLNEQLQATSTPLQRTSNYYRAQSALWEKSLGFVQYIPPVSFLHKASKGLLHNASKSIESSLQQRRQDMAQRHFLHRFKASRP